MGPLEIASLGLLSLLWGGSFFLVEVLVDALPPLTIVTVRVGLAAILLWVIIFARRVLRPRTLRDWGALAIVGLLNNALPFSLIVWAQTQIDSGLASILNATAPLFTVILAGVYLADERMSGHKLSGVLLGLIGVIVLIGPDIWLAGFDNSVLGQMAVVGAALCYALAGVYSRRFADRGISPLMVATGQVSTATLMLLPLMIWFDGGALGAALTNAPPLPLIGALLGLALLCTVLAYILYFRLIASAGATNAALVTFLIPISAIAMGVLILGERFAPLQILGALIIGFGLIVMDGRLWTRLRGRVR